MEQGEPTCKVCYWRRICPEWTRLYPCRMFDDTRPVEGVELKNKKESENNGKCEQKAD